ncbi:hypothetical protein T12_11797 [Trichinella patagoniensis]|uniref:Uncharacterized protein n=1 Tax=Trichinella patagoniensis TaxID=990121 RepID=A0A0V0ZYT0_9BILA|nr:hypothetical protein T12_11797 [Trichinella patagoniensis]
MDQYRMLSNANGKGKASKLYKENANARCSRCLRENGPLECPYVNAVCRFCNRKGHLEKAYFHKNKNQNNRATDNLWQKGKRHSTHFMVDGPEQPDE